MGKAAALSVAVKDRPYTSDGAKTMLLIGSRKRHLQVRWRDCVARPRLEFSMEADEVRVGIAIAADQPAPHLRRHHSDGDAIPANTPGYHAVGHERMAAERGGAERAA